jgi:hypothetical protein
VLLGCAIRQTPCQVDPAWRHKSDDLLQMTLCKTASCSVQGSYILFLRLVDVVDTQLTETGVSSYAPQRDHWQETNHHGATVLVTPLRSCSLTRYTTSSAVVCGLGSTEEQPVIRVCSEQCVSVRTRSPLQRPQRNCCARSVWVCCCSQGCTNEGSRAFLWLSLKDAQTSELPPTYIVR